MCGRGKVEAMPKVKDVPEGVISDKEFEAELEEIYGPDFVRRYRKYANLDQDELFAVTEFDGALERFVDEPHDDYAPVELFESAGSVRGSTLVLNSRDAALVSRLTGTPVAELLDYDDAGRAVRLWFSQSWESGAKH
jgi:hypothetical protein